MFENDTCTIFRKPSATTHMKHHLAVTHGKVVYTPTFGETVGRKVMPLLSPEVTLVKIDMDNAYLIVPGSSGLPVCSSSTWITSNKSRMPSGSRILAKDS